MKNIFGDIFIKLCYELFILNGELREKAEIEMDIIISNEMSFLQAIVFMITDCLEDF